MIKFIIGGIVSFCFLVWYLEYKFSKPSYHFYYNKNSELLRIIKKSNDPGHIETIRLTKSSELQKYRLIEKETYGTHVEYFYMIEEKCFE